MTEVIERLVTTDWNAEEVHAYLLDFSNAVEWDAGTVSCVRTAGDGGVGSRYRNVSRFPAKPWGRKSTLDYQVTSVDPKGGFVIEGGNGTVDSRDRVTIRPTASGGATVLYRAELTFHGPARFALPLIRPFLTALGDDTAAKLARALEASASR